MSVASSSLALLAGLAVVGCSFDRFEHAPCSTHAECRASFGFGAACGAEGLCEQVRFPPRCSATYPEDLLTDQSRSGRAVVFGTLMDDSIPAQVIRGRAARLAIKAANLAGGVDGRLFGLIECDVRPDLALDGETPSGAAVKAARFLTHDLEVPAIIGPSSSMDVGQVWQEVSRTGTLIISPAAMRPAPNGLEPVVSSQRPGQLWRTGPSDSGQGQRIVEDLRARKVLRATIMREGGAYGEGLARVVAEAFSLPGETLENVSLAAENQIDALVAGLPADDPAEVLFIASQPSWVARFLNRAAAEPGMAGRSIFLTDVAADPSVLAAIGGAADLFPRIRGTRLASRGPGDSVLLSFIADYRSEYGGESPTTAPLSDHSYDAAWLVVYGASWSLMHEGTVTGSGIASGFRRLQSGSPAPMLAASFPEILSSLRLDRPVNVSGASGELDFDPVTRELTGPIEIWTITNADGHPAITGLGPAGDKTSNDDDRR